ncbi:ELWxxDGT repeat protein [Aeromicrobium sp. P5_D10]
MKKLLSAAAVGALTFGLLTTPASASDFDAVPHLLKDLVPGGISSGVDEDDSAVLGNQLVFAAQKAGLGKELWITDGTAAGTRLIKDIDPLGTSNPASFISFRGKVYFAASDSTHGTELWVTDGTTAGTKLVKDIAPGNAGSSPRGFAVSGATLFMEATTTFTGRELWKTDGTPTGTRLVRDINDTAVGAESGITEIVALSNGRVIFSAEANAKAGKEPWVSDGTEAGTKQLNNINPDAGADSNPHGLTRVGSKIFFAATDVLNGNELWVTDGGSLSTHRVADLAAGPAGSDPFEIVAYGSRAVFQASSPGVGEEPWISDGTQLGTMPLEVQSGPAGSNPHDFTVFNGAVYFQAYSAGTGTEMWATKGTQGTTHLVKDICPGACHAEPGSFRRVGSTLVFPAYTTTHGGELWSSNGTSAGTVRRGDGIAGAGSSFPSPISVVGNTLFFTAGDPTHGNELWAYTTLPSRTYGYKKTVSRKTDKKRRVYVTVKVRASGTTPIGKVVLKKGTRVIGTKTLSGGNAKIRITKKLGKGKHKVRAYYYGSVRARSSYSSPFTIRVKSAR